MWIMLAMLGGCGLADEVIEICMDGGRGVDDILVCVGEMSEWMWSVDVSFGGVWKRCECVK